MTNFLSVDYEFLNRDMISICALFYGNPSDMTDITKIGMFDNESECIGFITELNPDEILIEEECFNCFEKKNQEELSKYNIDMEDWDDESESDF